MEPTISILVPVYQVEDYIERCARSVFEQTYPNIEYIFCNDCTLDRSMEVLERVIKDYPERAKRTRIIQFDENKGLATVRNTLVDACQTEWLLHEDSDDWMELDLVESLVKKQQETEADIVCADLILHHSDREERYSFSEFDKKEDYFRLVLMNNDAHFCWGKLIRTSLYKDNHIKIAPDCKKAEDMRVIIPLFYYANKIVATHQVGCHYNLTRPERISTLTEGNIKVKGGWLLDTMFVVKEFLSDKEEEYVKLFNKTIYEKICNYISLAVYYRNHATHQFMCHKAVDFAIQYPYVLGGSKERILFEIKSNYHIYRVFMNWLYRNEKAA
ncbi:MAG: glycosyltransferase family 2 protein [Prevotella sp.]|nr:glycosyltransferase family 2 protein [Prevotella sp.]